jgi:hypothetical protein
MIGLEVLNSSIHGKGLFTSRDIKKGTIIGVCKTKPHTGENGPYTLWLKDETSVDVTCRLKYINHSSKPNVAYRSNLKVEAISDIYAGEELLHDYGDDYK